nr:DUF302 domain-containing protein [Bradyrhizobium symbiodeficiens]AWM06127.1 DUF302 domain-containing protein [Bradyrhizobium symbiodeficiens]
MRKQTITLVVAFAYAAVIASAATWCSAAGTGTSKEEAVRLESIYSFSETLARLRAALEANGLRIFATIDHHAAAQSVGLDMPPTTVLIYGNPKGGTALMLAAPDFALELPLRLLVREGERGKVYVTYAPSANLEGKHGLPVGMAGKLTPERVITSAVTASSSNN